MAKAAGKSKSVETIMTKTKSITAKSVTEDPRRTHRGTVNRPNHSPTTPTATPVASGGALSHRSAEQVARMAAALNKKFPPGLWGIQSTVYSNPESGTGSMVTMLRRRPWRNNKFLQTEVRTVVSNISQKHLLITEYSVTQIDTSPSAASSKDAVTDLRNEADRKEIVP